MDFDVFTIKVNEYKTFVVKMAQDATIINNTKVTYELVCDVESLLGLTCIFPC
jgi:hypothetical protein